MKLDNQLIVLKDKTLRMQLLYYSMNEVQQANNEPWPYLGKGNDVKAGQIPPPPPPASPLDYIENAGDHINYYIDDEKVTAEKAKSFLKKNGNKGVQIMPVNGVNSLKMYTRVGVLRGT
jgi:hypothetical protein